MAKKPLPEGGQLVNIVCANHRRPSRLHVFTRAYDGDRLISNWAEFPTTFPPASMVVDDSERQARYAFDPTMWDLGSKRVTYSFRCDRCGAGPVVIRAEKLNPMLSEVWHSGNTRLALEEIADRLGA